MAWLPAIQIALSQSGVNNGYYAGGGGKHRGPKRSRNRKDIIVISSVLVLATVLILLLAACSPTKQSAPDPTGDQIQVKAPHQVIANPEGFRNVVETCDDGGNMLLVTSRGSDLAGGQNGGGLSSGIAVIVHDPRCAK